MNEWAAQRSFVLSTRSRILHPPYDAPLAVRAFGYLWRVAVVVLVPAAGFLFLVRAHVKGKTFRESLEKGAATYFEAPAVKLDGGGWQMANGKLSFRQLLVEDGPWFERLEAKDMITEVPVTAVFDKQWIFRRLSIGDVTVALKSGVAGAVPAYEFNDEDLDPAKLRGAPRPAADGAARPKLLRSGFGIDPDFTLLQVRLVQAGRMNVSWGGGGSTRGSIKGAAAELVKVPTGWSMTANGGEFSQSWLKGLKLFSWKADITSLGATVSEAKLSQTAGGTVVLRGGVTFGDSTAVTGDADLVSVRLQDFVVDSLAPYLQATVTGPVKFSGGMNGTSGVGISGELNVEQGRVTNLPVLRALQLLTGEDSYGVLNVRSGKVEFTSGGGELASGLKVEVPKMTLNCEPIARLEITGAFQRGTVLDLTAAAGSAMTEALTGSLRIAVQSSAVERMKPAVAQRFFSEVKDGWHWLVIPVEGKKEAVSKAISEEMIKLHQESPDK